MSPPLPFFALEFLFASEPLHFECVFNFKLRALNPRRFKFMIFRTRKAHSARASRMSEADELPQRREAWIEIQTSREEEEKEYYSMVGSRIIS